MSLRLFFDNNSTTSPFPEVVEAMKVELLKGPRNPSSVHLEGQQARATLIQAREAIAQALQILPQWIFFTSGGTESMNTLIHSYASSCEKACSILSSSLEHSCVIEPLKELEKKGSTVTYLSSPTGRIDLSLVESACQLQKYDFMVLSAANSETGIIHPIEEIAAFAYERQIPLLVDGVAVLGKESITMFPGISGMGFSAHKFHGPKGIGFCIAKPKKNFIPLLRGGPQESNRRAGTENLPAIIGMAEAIKKTTSTMQETHAKMTHLRDLFAAGLKKIYPELLLIGEGKRLCNTLAVAFPTKDGETLLIALDQAGIAASHGSACSSGSMQPSRVLKEMGLDSKIVKSGIRFSLSRFTTEEDINEALKRMKQILS